MLQENQMGVTESCDGIKNHTGDVLTLEPAKTKVFYYSMTKLFPEAFLRIYFQFAMPPNK